MYFILTRSPHLCQEAINLIVIIQIQTCRSGLWINVLPIEHKSHSIGLHPLPSSIRRKHLLHLGSLLNLKHGLLPILIFDTNRNRSILRLHLPSTTTTSAIRPTVRFVAHPPHLRQHAIDLIFILQFQHFRRFVRSDAFSIQEETKGCHLDALAGRVGGKYLGHLGGFFDFEHGFLSGLILDADGDGFVGGFLFGFFCVRHFDSFFVFLLLLFREVINGFEYAVWRQR
mmetsp:Transcript_25066/g.53017  ORF Transcript_25066/g.53017 Transcript_25066/m.53017 type:complete len:228 (-) Transcript_25066:101-784(-)